eukprot:TRINITY_DN2158_c0_g1_i3.p1 TRINITY_DN2158_c0_g1~~TRINITY_DN2158_c0_g1_i3.p1  ORF type:complete len:430 (+),score=68.63 TRINITY_DN2158_c0_g1_i3:35-1324(+)
MSTPSVILTNKRVSANRSARSATAHPFFSLFRGTYVGKAGLESLKTYKYVGIDHSIIAKHIMQPFWTSLVPYLPMWMAPNMVTLIGFAFIITSYFITTSYTPLLVGAVPQWLYFFNFLCMFIYQTMDALDGKQARRTGSSSPLGELFDHGCDAVTTVLSALTFMGAVQVGAGPFALFSVVSMMLAFYMTQWEEYHTGVLELGYVGVTEGQLSIMFIYLFSTVTGYQFWANTLPLPSWLPIFGGYALPYGYVPVLTSIVAGYFTIISNLLVVIKVAPSLEPKLTPGAAITKAYTRLVPIVFLSVMFIAWSIVSPTRVLQLHPQLFLSTLGFLASILVGRIVLARVCKEHFPPFQPLLIPLAAVFLIWISPHSFVGTIPFPQHTPANSEEVFLYLYTVVAVLGYLHLALSVIAEICAALKIRCMHIVAKQV